MMSLEASSSAAPLNLHLFSHHRNGPSQTGGESSMYLVEVDNRLPEVVLLLVEVPHTNLTEVTGMVLYFFS